LNPGSLSRESGALPCADALHLLLLHTEKQWCGWDWRCDRNRRRGHGRGQASQWTTPV